MLSPRLGQVRLFPSPGFIPVGVSREPRLYCITRQPGGAQIKKEWKQQGLQCVNTWTSPPGIYPGVQECRPDGEAPGCPVPPPPPMMSGPRRRLGQNGGTGCQIPGTSLKPLFDPNWNASGACGLISFDTSNIQYPECVQAPPGYPGSPAQGGWIPPICAQPGQAPPGGPPAAGGSPPAGGAPPITPPSCCKPTADGISCEFPGQGFSDYRSEQLTPEVLAMIEQQCGGVTGPPGTQVTTEVEPPIDGGGVLFPVEGGVAPPTDGGPQPPFEEGPPVLPPRQTYTTPTVPTGAFPGAPFTATKPMQAIAPAPIREACPLGPVPIARWANDCAMAKLRK